MALDKVPPMMGLEYGFEGIQSYSTDQFLNDLFNGNWKNLLMKTDVRAPFETATIIAYVKYLEKRTVTVGNKKVFLYKDCCVFFREWIINFFRAIVSDHRQSRKEAEKILTASLEEKKANQNLWEKLSGVGGSLRNRF